MQLKKLPFNIRLKKSVLELLIFRLLYLILFLIDMSQEMCDKAVDYNANALEFVPDLYKTQEMCNNLLCASDY